MNTLIYRLLLNKPVFIINDIDLALFILITFL